MLFGKVSLGNSITSIKEIIRVNFLNLFEKINGVEEILQKDPVNVYGKMDYKTKDYYRNKIKELSEETKISEIYIARKALELAQESYDEGMEKSLVDDKKAHIGYYLISYGISLLLANLSESVNKVKNDSGKNIYKKKAKRYVSLNIFITTLLSCLVGVYIYYISKNITLGIISAILLYIPISEICIQTINYILSKITKPVNLPKLELSRRYTSRVCYFCYNSHTN